MQVKDHWIADSALAKFLIYNGGTGRFFMLTNFSLSKDTHTQHSFKVGGLPHALERNCAMEVSRFFVVLHSYVSPARTPCRTLAGGHGYLKFAAPLSAFLN